MRTFVLTREEPRDGQLRRVVPTYELLSLRAAQLTNPVFTDLTVIVTGWGAIDPGEPQIGRPLDGDLNLAYAEGRLLDQRLRLRVGRQMLIGGSARNMQFDGLAGELTIWHGLGLSVHGGMPVTPRFATDLGDLMGGTRLFWRMSSQSEIGVSFLHVVDEDITSRQEVGADARWAPLSTLSVGGQIFFSVLDQRLAEGDVGVQWQPRQDLQVAADYRHTAPDLFIPASSIFSVFSDEERDEVGGDVSYRPVPRIRLGGDYHFRLLEVGGGHDTGIRARVALGRAYDTSLGVEARYLHDPSNGYVHARVTASHRLTAALAMTLEAAAYRFNDPINNQDMSFTGVATASYDFAPRWQVLVSGVTGVTPFLARRFEIMARLSYGFSWDSSEAQGAEAATEPEQVEAAETEEEQAEAAETEEDGSAGSEEETAEAGSESGDGAEGDSADETETGAEEPAGDGSEGSEAGEDATDETEPEPDGASEGQP